MGFTLFVDDPYFWWVTAVKYEVTEYYKYAMTYGDEIISVSMYAVSIL